MHLSKYKSVNILLKRLTTLYRFPLFIKTVVNVAVGARGRGKGQGYGAVMPSNSIKRCSVLVQPRDKY